MYMVFMIYLCFYIKTGRFSKLFVTCSSKQFLPAANKIDDVAMFTYKDIFFSNFLYHHSSGDSVGLKVTSLCSMPAQFITIVKFLC